MSARYVLLIALVLPLISGIPSGSCLSSEPDQGGIEFFEKRIRPLLADQCYECHSGEEQEGELRLDRYGDILAGGRSGPAVVPEKAESSLLVTAVRYIDSELQMPPDEKLTEAQIADLVQWVKLGALHPDAHKNPEMQTVSDEAARPSEKAIEHWAFQPPVEPTLPAVQHSHWPRSPLDVFVLNRLEEAGLEPMPPADRRTLIRRATFDLIGLPPTPEEVEAFESDQSPGAFARVVDRLLASPHYGERWGRHWLDVARYADSNGLDENAAQANAWRYRDYVIDAFNADKPYDVFVQEQLAGDLLATDDPNTRNERLTATGFLSLGPKVLAEVDKTKMEMDIIDEQIDTMGKAMLGLTFGCARCHDHKFDPISMQDYYALAGIFKSTHTMESFKTIAKWNENELFDESYQKEKSVHDAEVAAKQSTIEDLLASATATLQAQLGAGAALPAKPEESFPAETQVELKKKREELAALKKEAPKPPSAMGVHEGEATDVAIHIRGSHLTLGEIVSRGVPEFFPSSTGPPIESERSGRMALAEWMTSTENPLTARVMVNRIWRWHFGRGLVNTTDNFGTMGEEPTHPELLDWLAMTFVQDGWSIKQLHRRIMLSATYRLSSAYDAASEKVDPRNELYWRSNIRRMEAEELRDALLAVSGLLDLTRGGPSIETENYTLVFNHTSQDETKYDHRRRSVYLPVIRNHLHDSFTLFDYTDASMPNGNRNTSTVASQALYLMNSQFLADVSSQLADHVLSLDVESVAERICRLYQIAVGRPATDDEIAIADRYFKRFEKLFSSENIEQEKQEVWRLISQSLLISNEFVYIR